MNRWTRLPLANPTATFFVALQCLLAPTAGLFSTQSVAQGLLQPAVREFPRAAVRGTLVVTQPPNIVLDRNPDRLSPGARIRASNNLLVLSGAIVGQELTVNYVRDPQGLVHEVWILTPDEIAAKRPNMRDGFLSGTQTAPLPSDDGKTPYSQLPRFGTPPVATPVQTPNQ